MNIEAKKAKYYQLCHAMQSGVALKMEKDPLSTSPKHLRVGVNSAMVEHGALVQLLLDKGIFTEDEYWDALIEGMEREVHKYEVILSELYGDGRDIKLSLK